MSGFRFKQFFVAHDRCAMKVGTDGVLLGAWAARTLTCNSALSILDVGTGTGLVALMIAQKLAQHQAQTGESSTNGEELEWHIDAIDIDPDAVSQAADNFAHSPWADHLHACHSALQDWHFTPPLPTAGNTTTPPLRGGREGYYHLIVSNPPYFVDSLKNPDAQRQAARHTDTLRYEELIGHSVRLLTEDGRIQLILPIEAEKDILRIAGEHGLMAEHILYIRTTPRKSPKRLILTLKRVNSQSSIVNCDTLTLMGENNEPRSAAYSDLCRDYYL